MNDASATVIQAGAVRDASGVSARPGEVWVERGEVVAAGEPGVVPAEVMARARVVAMPEALVLPAMVNAHTHMQLTQIGPQPYDPAGGFVGWVKMLRHQLNTFAHPDTIAPPGQAFPMPDWLGASAEQGGRLAYAAGVQAVGDIGSTHHVEYALTRARLDSIVFAEVFGLGPAPSRWVFETSGGLCTGGIQPHAPYSAGPPLFERVSQLASEGRPVSTHLAETQDELQLTREGTGPLLDYVKGLGKWDESYAAYYGQGLSPVQWMRPYLELAADAGGWLVAHCNYVGDEDIALLADTNTSVAYCPNASEYFGHTGHRYRDMLAAGVNVCLGTDSIVCAKQDDPQPLGLLSAMRRLYQRDSTDPGTLLQMATVNGAKALRGEPNYATLGAGARARFACIDFDPAHSEDALVQALKNRNPITRLDLV